MRAAPGQGRRRDDEHELTLVNGAIDLIASGRASRVTLIGLRTSARLLPRAMALGHEAGMTVRADWHDADDGCDLTVEAIR